MGYSYMKSVSILEWEQMVVLHRMSVDTLQTKANGRTLRLDRWMYEDEYHLLDDVTIRPDFWENKKVTESIYNMN